MSASLYSRDNDYGCTLKVFITIYELTSAISRPRQRQRQLTRGQINKKISCIIQKLNSFVMVPYGLAIFGIERSDRKKQKKKRKILGIVLDIINASSPSVFSPKYVRETLSKLVGTKRAASIDVSQLTVVNILLSHAS